MLLCVTGALSYPTIPILSCLSSQERCSSHLIILMVSLWTCSNRSILKLVIPVQQKCTKDGKAVEPTAVLNIFCPPGDVYWALEVLVNLDIKIGAGKEKRNTILKQTEEKSSVTGLKCALKGFSSSKSLSLSSHCFGMIQN